MTSRLRSAWPRIVVVAAALTNESCSSPLLHKTHCNSSKLLTPSCPKWRSNRLCDLARRGGGRASQAESWQTKQNKHQSSWNFKYAQAGEIIVLGSFVSTFNRNSCKRDRHCTVFGYVADVKWKRHRFHKINIAAAAKQEFRPVFSDCRCVGLSFHANPVYILRIFFQGKLRWRKLTTTWNADTTFLR